MQRRLSGTRHCLRRWPMARAAEPRVCVFSLLGFGNKAWTFATAADWDAALFGPLATTACPDIFWHPEVGAGTLESSEEQSNEAACEASNWRCDRMILVVSYAGRGKKKKK